MDLSSPFRFAGLPNRCVLEMVELSTPRTPQLVTLCVIDQQGNKHIRDHQPSGTLTVNSRLDLAKGFNWLVEFNFSFLFAASLWSILESTLEMAPYENDESIIPVVVYSMQRIAGRDALTQTTLKSLGLSTGRGAIRYSFMDW